MRGDNCGAIEDFGLEGHAISDGTLNGALHRGSGIDILVVEIGSEEIISDLDLGGCPQETVTLDTREAPVVLTLKERATGETIDLQGHDVLAHCEIIGDIKLGRHIRVLAIAHTLSVDPEIEAVPYPIETYIDIMVGEHLSRHRECLTIGAYRIGHATVVLEPVRATGHDTIRGLVEREGIGHITIERLIP